MRKFDFPKQTFVVEWGGCFSKEFVAKTAAIKFAREMRKRFQCASSSSMGVTYWL